MPSPRRPLVRSLLAPMLAVAFALAPVAGERAWAAGPSGAASKGGTAPKTAEQDRAQVAFTAALKLYKAGQYRAAIDKLIEARKLDPSDKLLPYNLGLVYEKLGDIDNAIKNYQISVNLETDEAEKERVKGIIQRLEGARSELVKPPPVEPSASAPASASAAPIAPPPPDEPTEPAEPARRKKGRLDGWVYGTAGLSVVGLAAGAFFGVRALSLKPKDPTTGNGKTLDDLQSDADRAHQTAVLADVSFAVGVLAGGAAAALYFARDAAPPPVAGVVAPRPGGAEIGLFGRF